MRLAHGGPEAVSAVREDVHLDVDLVPDEGVGVRRRVTAGREPDSTLGRTVTASGVLMTATLLFRRRCCRSTQEPSPA